MSDKTSKPHPGETVVSHRTFVLDEKRAPSTPDPKDAAHEAAFAAAMSDTYAQRAAAAEAVLAAVAPVEDKPREPRCPICNGELTKHGDANPYKVGAWHCDGCGSCWAAGLKHQREGHSPPTPATA